MMLVTNFTRLSRLVLRNSRFFSTATSNHSINITFDNSICILNLGEGEKRFNHQFMKDFHSALDEIESNTKCEALVCTAEGKFFSNGLDFEWLIKQDERENKAYFKDVRKLLERVLILPFPTTAALNGHTFAAGAILAFAHDFRFMRNDKGWISLNEIFLKLRFHDFLFQILKSKIPPGQARNEAIILGKRFTAPEAKEYGFVETISEEPNLLPSAVQFMKTLVDKKNYDRKSMMIMKSDLYNNVLKASDDYYTH